MALVLDRGAGGSGSVPRRPVWWTKEAVVVVDTGAYADAFRLIDANADGLISAAELKQLMAALGDEITDDAAGEAVRIIDTDSDGLISLEEFAGYLSSRGR